MTRPVAVMLAVVLLAGCRGSGAKSGPNDPFFGRTRVEPPRTGSVAGQPPDPSYPNSMANPLRSPTPSPYKPTTAIPAGTTTTPRPDLSSGWTPVQPQPASETPPAVASSASPPPAVGFRPPGGNYDLGPDKPAGTLMAVGAGDRVAIPSAALTMPPPVPASAAPPATSAEPLRAAANANPATGVPVIAATAAPNRYPQGSLYSRPNSSYAGGNMSRPTIDALANRERITRVIEPRPHGSPSSTQLLPVPMDASAGAVAANSAAAPPTADRVINITELPVSSRQ